MAGKKKTITNITLEILLSEILKIPGAEKILEEYRLPCLTCPFAKYEIERLKLGEVCRFYGINPNSLLKDLNDLINPVN